ncbi:hypothetical protein H4S06_005433 [Coemansia sp. BCRC 34490]|nr:hypothetical protein LPJ72_000439 [Coemansia sp. Benny D160-2]KAJ2515373.1 hypothetical protein H4217_005202 [Coemansia sp. RSA 1939]KAJ2524865.1 hypothetical protein GGI11_000515 [Coemansia sp. RSA 2049]KAJ2612544.1 hypothetical protein EV177_002928 [Coemansia sp. RSA 1804]KAJ2663283.1 hypothetical protein IWW48_001385 [Coemansia sp. RSA 1200]KAJ2691529.1 hypothetical protein GGH99_002359 [Coemansia sp. RSA 1285]KAJ2744549.1 hypothetical protein H4S06_005433 [Coemansia sp. BCRC 34490]
MFAPLKPGQQFVPIAKFRPSMRGFDCEVIVLETAVPTTTRDGQMIYNFLVADKSASILMNVWGDDGRYIRNGDIIRIEGAEAKLFKGFLQLTTARFGKLRRVGEDTMEFKEHPNISELQWVTEQESKAMKAELQDVQH